MSERFDDPLAIYPDENLEDFRAEYVRLTAKWRSLYTPEQVCQYIFKNLREPSRYLVAAHVFSSDLELTEAVDNLLVGKKENTDKKQNLNDRLEAIIDDPATGAKDKIAAIQLIAQMEGLIIKQVEKKIDTKQEVATRITFVEDVS